MKNGDLHDDFLHDEKHYGSGPCGDGGDRGDGCCGCGDVSYPSCWSLPVKESMTIPLAAPSRQTRATSWLASLAIPLTSKAWVLALMHLPAAPAPALLTVSSQCSERNALRQRLPQQLTRQQLLLPQQALWRIAEQH